MRFVSLPFRERERESEREIREKRESVNLIESFDCLFHLGTQFSFLLGKKKKKKKEEVEARK